MEAIQEVGEAASSRPQPDRKYPRFYNETPAERGTKSGVPNAPPERLMLLSEAVKEIGEAASSRP